MHNNKNTMDKIITLVNEQHIFQVALNNNYVIRGRQIQIT